MTTTAPHHHLRELDRRHADGIDVRLLWNRWTDRVLVAVSDTRTGARFSVDVPAGARPLHVFHHPYAYATAAA